VSELPQDELPRDERPENRLSQDAGAAAAQPGRLDAARVGALYVKHAEELRRFLRGVLCNSESAEDALQNTFAKAIELGHTARDASIRAWLFRVAMNEALLMRRRQQVHRKALESHAVDQSDGTIRRQVESQAIHDSPVGSLVRLETVRQLRDALAELPEEQRIVVTMRLHEEKTFATIASELGVPLGTVLSRMRAALQKLRQRLDGKT
jgi:RNA polymerase sigma-70 factor, ECF subfamily